MSKNSQKAMLAKHIKNLYDELSPIIEEFTSTVCPDCESVCCKQKHGLYEPEDLAFLVSLGEKSISDGSHERDPEGSCEFLGSKGCIRPRWQRPFRCTWFFCEPLLTYMPERSPRLYRRMVALLNEIIESRKALLCYNESQE